MERKQFTFYRSYFEAVSNLPKSAQTAVLLAICDYALNEKAPKLTGAAGAVFSLIKPTLDTSRKRAELGVNYGKGKKEKAKQTDSKPIANAKQTDSEGEKEIEIELEKELEYEIELENEHEKENDYSLLSVCVNNARENTPTLEEIKAYANSNGIAETTATKFFDTYSSTGWMVNGQPIVDWQARLRLWQKEDSAKGKASAKPKPIADMRACMEKNMRRAATGS